MVTKSSTTEIPLSLNASLTLVQNLGNELGYELKEKDDTHITWKVKGNLFRSAYELEVRLKAANENNTEVEVVAKHWALADGAGILTAGVDDFLRRVREKAGLSVVSVADETPKRGGCLTAFLILAMIGNPVLALIQWALAGNLPSDMASLAVIGGVLNVAGLIFAIGVWKWKKWGVYGYVGSMGLFILLNLVTGQILPALQGLVPIALLIGLTQPVWKYFGTEVKTSPSTESKEQISTPVLLLLWVITNVLASIAFGILYPLFNPTFDESLFVANIVTDILCATIAGTLQWLLLILVIQNANRFFLALWIPASIVGWAIMSTAYAFLTIPPNLEILISAVGGLTIGILQWFILQKYSKVAFWWIPAQLIDSILASLLFWPIWDNISNQNVANAMSGVAGSIASSIAIVYILKHTLSNAHHGS